MSDIYKVQECRSFLLFRIALEELLGRCPGFKVDFAKGEFSSGNYVRRYISMPFSASGAA